MRSTPEQKMHNQIEQKYGIAIFEIKYVRTKSPYKGICVHSKSVTEKGKGFKQWAKKLLMETEDE